MPIQARREGVQINPFQKGQSCRFT